MEEQSFICPYTGLRPFTEDESLYFKGRDEHINQATKQLEKNKFIMLTGASGDGKSSLVYAGIVPNAKAGFLKSQFSNWVLVDFRPERNPLGNLCRVLAKQLGIANESTVRTELSHGFSALVDIYKASSLYTNTSDVEWSELDDNNKTIRKRSSANLIIVADQFEEFFTNPENFHKGVPSQEADLVTNLLLETARIALEEKLPIYIIITMRSDFIGQCASFRGLPEAIGFSQFFVPRLNRAQLQEVIEEPAVLSGNRISRRLTERLIHDMVEGTDQLPILQHALNQIWKMADEGAAEMDLLHYAMVGGMNGTELPAADMDRFKKWFAGLPAKIQACYDQPDLQNVLNTHANKLYQFAADSYRQQHKDVISDQDAARIIESAFKCLTKIDSSRAVRNRMTLGEITAIINQPHLDFKKVGKVLSIFREPGNTLLRPFTEKVPELNENSVLDITHESLIRNWGNLAQWAKDEFESYTTYLDFSQQLNRWVESGKSNSFLLYIGPLTFFENWFEKNKPNAEWIARYLGEELEHDQRKAKATSILNNAQEFLQRSASKHAITRAVMKYGPRRIAAGIGIVLVIVLSSFGLKAYLDRRDTAVLESIKEQSIQILNNPKLRFGDRGWLAVNNLQLNLTTLSEIIERVKDPLEKIKVANGIAVALVVQGRTEPAIEISKSLAITDSLFSQYPVPFGNAKQLSDYISIANDWRATLGLAHYYNPSKDIFQLQIKNAQRGAQTVLTILQQEQRDFTDIANFSIMLEDAINFNAFTQQQLQDLIKALSPFDGNERSEWVTSRYTRDVLRAIGYQGYSLNYNGLYQKLAYLYAATGNPGKALQAMDTVLKYNSTYFMSDYATMLDNATNVASVFYRSNQANSLDEFVQGYCARKKITEIAFYQRLQARLKPYQLTRNVKFFDFWVESQNLNLQYGDQEEIGFFFEMLREAIQKSNDADERNFLLAISYKDEGIFTAHRAEVVNKKYDEQKLKDLFDKSLKSYQQVSPTYLNQPIERVGVAASEILTSPRSSLYLYPDVNSTFMPHGGRDFHFSHMSSAFMEHLIDENIFQKLYAGAIEQKYLESWLTDYHFHIFSAEVFLRSHASLEFMVKLEKALATMQASSNLDLNLLYLYTGYYALERNDQPFALTYYLKVKPENLGNIFNYRIFVDLIKSSSFILVGKAFTCLTENNKLQEADHLLSFFKKQANRSSLYAFAAREFVQKSLDQNRIQPMLDSARAEMLRVENINSVQPNRAFVGLAQVMNEPTDNSISSAKALIKNQPFKFTVLQFLARVLSYRGELYKAMQMIPDNLSDSDRLFFLYSILKGYQEGSESKKEWEIYNNNAGLFNRIDYLNYVDETN